MCGIVGFLTNRRTIEEFERKKFLASALAVDTVRGADSTGMFLAPHDKLVGVTPATLRGTCDGYAFVNDDAYRKQVTNLDRFWAVVGHNRSATKGSVSLKNTHPFVRGPITLVHNGTVWNSDQLGGTTDTDADVDSDQICAALAENHVEDVAKLISGSFALVWHDKRDGKVRFLRNSERPIHLAATDDGNTIYFASEAEMLWFVAKRANVRLRTPFQPLPGTLLAFSRDNLLTPEVSAIKLSANPVVTYGPGSVRGAPFTGRGGGVIQTSSSSSARSNFSAALEDEFKKFGIIPDASYTFLPTAYTNIPSSVNMCRLSGYLPVVEHNAVIWDLNAAIASTSLAAKAPMAVRVVGVRYITTNTGTTMPLFVCEYRSRGEGNDTLASPRSLVAGETILGPEGRQIEVEQWCEWVGEGCKKCGVLILPEDADVITWHDAGEGKASHGGRWEPVCNACSIVKEAAK